MNAGFHFNQAKPHYLNQLESQDKLIQQVESIVTSFLISLQIRVDTPRLRVRIKTAQNYFLFREFILKPIRGKISKSITVKSLLRFFTYPHYIRSQAELMKGYKAVLSIIRMNRRIVIELLNSLMLSIIKTAIFLT